MALQECLSMGFELWNYNTANKIVAEFNSSCQDEHLKQLIVSCLQNPLLSKSEVA
jgi:hypothetical protein